MKPDAASVRRENRQRYADRVLTSWSEIADFAGRSVRTVQRWEEFYDLPVHRNEKGLFAYPAEIDEWMQRPLSFRTDLDLNANRRWNRDIRMDAQDALVRSRELRKQAQSERAQAQRLRKRA